MPRGYSSDCNAVRFQGRDITRRMTAAAPAR